MMSKGRIPNGFMQLNCQHSISGQVGPTLRFTKVASRRKEKAAGRLYVLRDAWGPKQVEFGDYPISDAIDRLAGDAAMGAPARTLGLGGGFRKQGQ